VSSADWYDPQTGRFLSQDPIGLAGGVNLYAYAGNNPASYSDPFGLLACCFKDEKKDESKRAIARTMFGGGIPQPADAGPGPADAGALQGTLVDPSAFLGPAELKAGLLLLVALPKEGALVIGKMATLSAKGALTEGEHTLLPKLAGDLGSPKANWARNAGVLRSEMARGAPIRDASVDATTGALKDNTGFLRAERNLLQDRGWTYDAQTTFWSPP
jgi:hypothetical protein